MNTLEPSGDPRPVLLTGATGFVGSHVAEKLIRAGARVRCLVRRSSRLAWLPPGVEVSYGELRTGEGLREAVSGVRVVFHLAGVTKANRIADYYSGNVQGTENLLRALEASAEEAVRFVHVSSLAAVGPAEGGIALAEDALPHPVSHYGKSKLEGERAVRASSLGSRAVIVRPSVVYGPRDTDVLEFFRAVARGLIVCIGPGEAFFSSIHVEDLAEGLMTAGLCGPAHGGTYFLANAEAVSWRQFGMLAAQIMGRRRVREIHLPLAGAYTIGWLAETGSRLRRKPGILSRDKVREGQHRFWICDIARAREELRFSPRIPLAEGIAQTLNWYKMVGWLRY